MEYRQSETPAEISPIIKPQDRVARKRKVIILGQGENTAQKPSVSPVNDLAHRDSENGPLGKRAVQLSIVHTRLTAAATDFQDHTYAGEDDNSDAEIDGIWIQYFFAPVYRMPLVRVLFASQRPGL